MNLSNRLRLWFIQMFGIQVIMVTLLFFVGVQLYLFTSRNPMMTLQQSLILTSFLFLLLVLVSLYFGFKGVYTIKGRIDDIVTYLTVLRSGRFSVRIDHFEQDLMEDVVVELNLLAEFIQDQVKTLQRVVDEKSELAKKAHQAASIEERQRLARDLHDSVSQQLFALSMLSSATVRTFESKPEEALKLMKQSAGIANKAQGEMRALLLHLRPVDLKGDSFYKGLYILMKELKERTALEIEAAMEDIDDLSKATEEHLFRIVQEALSNILRHASATKVLLSSERIHDFLHVYISDNGSGFKVEENKMTSYGLQTMKERCAELGGVFQIRSKEGEGTYINIRIPYHSKGES